MNGKPRPIKLMDVQISNKFFFVHVCVCVCLGVFFFCFCLENLNDGNFQMTKLMGGLNALRELHQQIH